MDTNLDVSADQKEEQDPLEKPSHGAMFTVMFLINLALYALVLLLWSEVMINLFSFDSAFSTPRTFTKTMEQLFLSVWPIILTVAGTYYLIQIWRWRRSAVYKLAVVEVILAVAVVMMAADGLTIHLITL